MIIVIGKDIEEIDPVGSISIDLGASEASTLAVFSISNSHKTSSPLTSAVTTYYRLEATGAGSLQNSSVVSPTASRLVSNASPFASCPKEVKGLLER